MLDVSKTEQAADSTDGRPGQPTVLKLYKLEKPPGHCSETVLLPAPQLVASYWLYWFVSSLIRRVEIPWEAFHSCILVLMFNMLRLYWCISVICSQDKWTLVLIDVVLVSAAEIVRYKLYVLRCLTKRRDTNPRLSVSHMRISAIHSSLCSSFHPPSLSLVPPVLPAVRLVGQPLEQMLFGVQKRHHPPICPHVYPEPACGMRWPVQPACFYFQVAPSHKAVWKHSYSGRRAATVSDVC